jgi:hypothetical protein
MIYITQQKKEEIEAKIAELQNEEVFGDAYYIVYGTIQTLEQILSEAIVLPVEESWVNCDKNNLLFKQAQYPNGVIIKSK